MRTRLFAIVLVTVACSDSSPAAPAATPGANQVFMQGSAFNPVTRTVAAGTTVEFVNKDGLIHTATSSAVPGGASAFTTGSLSLNGTASITLSVPGTYQYYCVFHGTPATGMRGTIVVN